MNTAWHKPIIKALFPAVLLIFFAANCLYAASAAGIPHETVAGTLDGIILIISGIFIGILGTLIGAGGGFLIVPMLIILYGL